MGDYLFTDADFITHLSTEHRNVFQKIYDEIKYLCKVVTAGSKEARQLEKVKKMFEDVYRAGTEAQKNTAESGVRYDLQYNDAIDKLAKNELERSKNTHLKLLDHTPQLYIDKAGAKDLKIIMGWDIAYLAMNKSGDIQGNYHGLGADVMKDIPRALQDPIYIVKQDNGRIAAVTELVVKGNRSTIAVIELDAFKSTTQDGNNESDNYNLIVTVMDAKPNYLQNTILDGDIVYNKNNEDPANFILRLKSLTKAMSNDDLARSSNNSISPNDENVNRKNSLSFDSESDIPIKQGSYNVYGEDVRIEPQGDDFAPMREDAVKQNTVERDTAEGSLTPETKDADSFTQDTVSSFGIQKMGDYIHVQRQVFDTLLNEGFFTDISTRSRVVTNESTGMDIEINKKGIFETFNLNNYGRLGKFKKIAKLSTIRQIPDALKYGTVIADDIENIYNDGNNKTFAYIEYPTKVNGKDVVLKLAIKKSSQKNKFWVHSLYDVKSVSGSSASTDNSTEAGHITADTDKIVPQKSKGVKREFTEPEFIPPTKKTQNAEEAVPKAEATEEVQSSASEGSEPSSFMGE